MSAEIWFVLKVTFIVFKATDLTSRMINVACGCMLCIITVECRRRKIDRHSAVIDSSFISCIIYTLGTEAILAISRNHIDAFPGH